MSTLPTLYACLYAREFPAQAILRLRPELRGMPCVILEGTAPSQTVCSLNAKARSLGVTHGMTTVELDTFPSVITLSRSKIEEAAAKSAALECAGTFSPRIEDLSEGNAFLCMIDIAGTRKLLGAPSGLGQRLLASMQELGISASVTVSANFHAGLCHVCGICGPSRVNVIPAGQESTALAPLPIAVLGLTDDHVETFASWGIQTLGMLAVLPETELIARMGQEGRRLRRLARGEHTHLFVPIEPEFLLHEHMELDTPVDLLESLLFVIGVMLEQLILRATSRVLALASVTITMSLEGGAKHARTVRPALPSNDRQLWIKLLHLDLEAHPPQAAIVQLSLGAEPGNTSKVQLGLFSPQLPEPMRLDVTLARIRAIVGEDAVGSAVLKDTHKPDQFLMQLFSVKPAKDSSRRHQPAIAVMRQLRPAEVITVNLRADRPIAFSFRAKRYEAERVFGPWMASGEWWSGTRWGVQQWDVVARSQDGVLLCCSMVCDLRRNLWEMAALYD